MINIVLWLKGNCQKVISFVKLLQIGFLNKHHSFFIASWFSQLSAYIIAGIDVQDKYPLKCAHTNLFIHLWFCFVISVRIVYYSFDSVVSHSQMDQMIHHCAPCIIVHLIDARLYMQFIITTYIWLVLGEMSMEVWLITFTVP